MLFRQRHEMLSDAPMAPLFRALLDVLAPGRWGLEEGQGAYEPAAGSRYRRHVARGTRHGRVVECLRPVSLILVETLFEGAYKRRVRLRCRIQPLGDHTRLLLDVSIEFNAASLVRKRHCLKRVARECEDLLGGIEARVERGVDAEDQGRASGVSGQNTGSSSIDTTNMTTVKGRPILR